MTASPARLEALQAELDVLYPDPRCELDHRDAFELLVATVLSAQTTDKRVNEVTPALFARYPDATTMARATPEELVPFLRTLGLFNNKAKALSGLARILVERHGGQVPANLAALIELPGVARKTANVVLQNIWGIHEGFVVDTHVTRLSARLGLSAGSQVPAIERDLMAAFPREHWGRLSHQLILHGRRVCDARRPRCGECTLASTCPATGRG